MPLDGLIVAFGLANIFASLPITPGGLGIVEGIYIPTLVGFGLSRSVATLGVLTYRVAQYWLPILLGGLAYLSLRSGRGRSPAVTASSASGCWPRRRPRSSRAVWSGRSAMATAPPIRRSRSNVTATAATATGTRPRTTI